MIMTGTQRKGRGDYRKHQLRADTSSFKDHIVKDAGISLHVTVTERLRGDSER